MTRALTSRQKYILHMLADHQGMSMEEIVRRLAVSRRTIQRDIHVLQTYLTQFDVLLNPIAGNIHLQGEHHDIARALAQAGNVPVRLALTPKGRMFYVALELLLTQGPLKLNYLGKRLQVTSASVSRDLDQISDWLRSRGLKLIRRQGYGVEVTGDDTARLESVAELVHEQLSMYELMSVLRGQAVEQTELPLRSWLANWFGAERVQKLRDVLTHQLADFNPPLDEAAFYGFMLHVIMTCLRIEEHVHLEPVTADGTTPTEVELCARILQEMLPGIQHVEGEAQYLAKHLRGAKVQMTEESRILPLNITTMDLAFQLTQRLSEMLQLPLSEDRDLLVSLAQHLEPAIYRMKAGLTIRNPLLEEVKRRYEPYFVAMRAVSRQVLGAYELVVPDTEIAYLTMHLGAALERWKSGNVWRVKIVCPNGISSAELLASRMRNQFPQVEVVSVDAVNTLDDSDCDFIVATVPLTAPHVPSITVSPFLNDEDVAGVQAILQALAQTHVPLAKQPVHAIGDTVEREADDAATLTGRMAAVSVGVANLAELIEQAAQRAVEAGDATDVAEVVEAVTARERLGSIVLPGKRFAVLHARAASCTRAHIAVYRLLRPIDMQGVGQASERVDTVLLLLARRDESAAVVERLGKLSSALITQPDLLEILRSAAIDDVRQAVLAAINQTQE